MSIVMRYSTDASPSVHMVGVYAVRIECDVLPLPFLRDEFLMWMNGKWSYLGSDQPFRGHVYGWLGPLERLKAGT